VPKKKYPKIYAFIDSQNLNLGTSKDIYHRGKIIYHGWKLDMKSFHRYLTEKLRVDKAFLFLGYIKKNEKMYEKFREYGYHIIFKPTVRGQGGKPKGNIDAELVLYSSAIFFKEFDKGIFVSGDGDFHCLYKFMKEKGKLQSILIPNAHTSSKLLNEFSSFCRYIYRDRDLLEKKWEASLSTS
jgi:uncharacterized LabA/DUF88 family protein